MTCSDIIYQIQNIKSDTVMFDNFPLTVVKVNVLNNPLIPKHRLMLPGPSHTGEIIKYQIIRWQF